MFTIYFKGAKDQPIEIISELKPGAWIHIDQGSVADLEKLTSLVPIEYTDLLDSLDKYELPRIERSGESLMIFTRYPTDQEIGLYTLPLTLILAPNAFITICPHRSRLVSNFLQVEGAFSTIASPKLLTLLLLKINQEFTVQIRKTRYHVLSAKKEMIQVDSDDITALTKNEEILNQYISSLAPIRSVLEKMQNRRYPNFYETEQELIEDCIHSIHQSEDLCNIVLKSICSLRDSYQIIFTNNLHKTIKLLTSLTIILSIPTMIASVYGMNVDLPLAKNTFAFGIVMSFTALFSIIGLWIFKKRGWL